MEFLGNVAGFALAALAGVAFGTIFSQRIKDYFAGVERDLRLKANEAGGAVLAAANGERDRVKDAMRAAADKAVAGAKAAVVGLVEKTASEVAADVAAPPAPGA